MKKCSVNYDSEEKQKNTKSRKNSSRSDQVAENVLNRFVPAVDPRRTTTEQLVLRGSHSIARQSDVLLPCDAALFGPQVRRECP